MRLFERERALSIIGVAGLVEAAAVAALIAYRGTPLVAPEGDLRHAVSAYAALGFVLLSAAALLPFAALSREARWTFRIGLGGAALYSYVFELAEHLRGIDPRFSEFWTAHDHAFAVVYFTSSQAYVVLFAIFAWGFFAPASARSERPAVVLGIRYATLSMFAGFGAGYMMLASQGRHTGSADWILLHGAAFHGLQLLPLVGWLAERAASPRRVVHFAGAAWLAGLAALSLHISRGRDGVPAVALACFAVVAIVGFALVLRGRRALVARQAHGVAAAFSLPRLAGYTFGAATLLGVIAVGTTASLARPRRLAASHIPCDDGYSSCATQRTLAPAPVPVVYARGMAFVALPGGRVARGCVSVDHGCSPDEPAMHWANVDGFLMARTEAPWSAYRDCMNDGACSALRSDPWTCALDPRDGDYPVSCIDYTEAETFCRWVGGRLPTVDEWEYAARGDADVVYPWGNEAPNAQRAAFGGSGLAPVGAHPEGASRWGVHDLAGNVWEWTASRYDTRFQEQRGGAWSYRAGSLRISNRGGATRDDAGLGRGVRCALDAVGVALGR